MQRECGGRGVTLKTCHQGIWATQSNRAWTEQASAELRPIPRGTWPWFGHRKDPQRARVKQPPPLEVSAPSLWCQTPVQNNANLRKWHRLLQPDHVAVRSVPHVHVISSGGALASNQVGYVQHGADSRPLSTERTCANGWFLQKLLVSQDKNSATLFADKVKSSHVFRMNAPYLLTFGNCNRFEGC